MYQYNGIRLAKDTTIINWKYDFPTLEIPKRVLTFLERNNINTYKDLLKLDENNIQKYKSGAGKIGQDVLKIIADIQAIEDFYYSKNISIVLVKNLFNSLVERIDSQGLDIDDFSTELIHFYRDLYTIPWETEKYMELVTKLDSYKDLQRTLILSTLKVHRSKTFEEVVNCSNILFVDIMIDDNYIDSILNEAIRRKILTVEDGVYSYNYPSIEDFLVENKGNKDLPIVNYRMDGLTLEEIGNKLGVTRERVRQRERKALGSLGPVFEDKYKLVFEAYNFSPESFAYIFDASPRIYNFLKLRYRAGTNDIEAMLDDEAIIETIKLRVDSYLKKDLIKIGDSFVQPKKGAILYWFISTYCTEDIKLQDAYDKYITILDEAEIEESLRFDLRNFGVRVSDSLYTVWKYQKWFRYYETRNLDINQLINDLGLYEYNNMEVSTELFVANRPDVLAEWEIHDKYELHNILKKYQNRINGLNIEFLRMPNIIIGKASREKQVIKLLQSESPISVPDFCALYEMTYGVDKATFAANYFSPITPYRHADMLSMDVEKMSDTMIAESRSILIQNFYSLKEITSLLSEHFNCDMSDYVNSYNINQLGYTLASRSIYKSEYTGMVAALEAHIADNGLMNSRTFDQSMYTTSTFYAALSDLRYQYKVLEIMPNQYIHMSHLEKIGITRADIDDFINAMIQSAHGTYFTYGQLKRRGFKHKLQDLGLDDYFYSSILRWSKHFNAQTYRYTILLSAEKKQVFLHELLRVILGERKVILSKDLLEELKLEYGIDYSTDTHKFLEHCTRGGLEYNKATGELIVSRIP